jgi:hypothetical protein
MHLQGHAKLLAQDSFWLPQVRGWLYEEKEENKIKKKVKFYLIN